MDYLMSMVIFARVVEANSFTAAADRLGISKSAVSKHVSRLEQHLRTKLLNRTTRRLSLTETGNTFYQYCSRIIAEAEQAELEVGRLYSEPRGVLKLNTPVTFGILHLAPLMPKFLSQYRDVRIEMTMTDRIIDLVEEGADLAIRIAHNPGHNYAARPLANSSLVICAAPKYLKQNGIPKSPADLANHNCLTYAYFSTRNTWRFLDSDGDITVDVDGNFKANNGETLREAALGGLGIALLPRFLIWKELGAGQLRILLSRYEVPKQTVYAVYSPNRFLLPKVRVFIDYLVERFGGTPYWEKSDQ